MSRTLSRARGLLTRRGGWIEGPGGDGTYSLRTGPDRRARPVLFVDEAGFRALATTPGLRVRKGGGWIARHSGEDKPDAPIGAPGRLEGERLVIDHDGRLVAHPANLGESPIAWLARRRDASGRPWLTPAEVAAAEKLSMDAEIASRGAPLTMRWDALPRSRAGGSHGCPEPGDRTLAAARRVAAALAACEPCSRAFVEHICIRSLALPLAERSLGVQRRSGKTLLRRGLTALARHYRIG